jgi:hypothetical protein
MSGIRDIYDRIAALLRSRPSIAPPVSLSNKTLAWAGFSRIYLDAAKTLRGQTTPLSLPWIQLIGQSLECAIKACLCVSNIEPDKTHNLITLFEKAERAGFTLPEYCLVRIVTLSITYYEQPGTGVKFMARFPTDALDGIGPLVDSPSFLEEAIDSLLDQAEAKLRTVV